MFVSNTSKIRSIDAFVIVNMTNTNEIIMSDIKICVI